MVCRGALSLKGNTAVLMTPEIDSPLCQYVFVNVCWLSLVLGDEWLTSPWLLEIQLMQMSKA